jgi:hypothetical protein
MSAGQRIREQGMNATATKTRSNTYAGVCSSCGTRVAAGAGLLGGKVNGRWTVRHSNCSMSVHATSTVSVRPGAHRCQECGRSGARWITDASGISGYACGRCTDGVSFA